MHELRRYDTRGAASAEPLAQNLVLKFMQHKYGHCDDIILGAAGKLEKRQYPV